jgi:hypothetical protein
MYYQARKPLDEYREIFAQIPETKELFSSIASINVLFKQPSNKKKNIFYQTWFIFNYPIH